ncbi:MAG: hypothetical protein AAGA18_15145 [Verrucomicrobiota bacterium]
MIGAVSKLEQNDGSVQGSVSADGLIPSGQRIEQGTVVSTDIPRLEGKELMEAVNGVIRGSILAEDFKEAAQVAPFEAMYRIGLEHPELVHAGNLQKLYENPMMMHGAGVAFLDLDSPELKRKYAAHAIEVFGRNSPEGIAAIERSHGHLTDEFMKEHNIPIDVLNLS